MFSLSRENRDVREPHSLLNIKQDLPTSASAPDVAVALGLTNHKQNQFNILGCVAKTPLGQKPDVRLRDGVRYVCVSAISGRGI